MGLACGGGGALTLEQASTLSGSQNRLVAVMPIRKNRKYEAEKEERKREADEDVGEVGEVDKKTEGDLNEEAVVGNDNLAEASPAFRGDLDETLAEAGDEWQKEVANGGGDRL